MKRLPNKARSNAQRYAWSIAACVLFNGAAVAPPARAADVAAGIDLFQSPPGVSSTDEFNSGAGGQPIPADFFAPGSDPFDGSIGLTGDPFPFSGNGPCLAPADTIVERLADAALQGCPATSTVPIQIVALSLVSSAPVTVTFNGGQNPELWDVKVCLSDLPQPIGIMIIQHDCPDGGTFTSDLPVQPKFIFTRQSDNTVRIFDTGLEGLPPTVFNTFGGWVHQSTISQVTQVGPGSEVDGNCDGILEVLPIGTSNFVPGIFPSPCDCTTPPGGSQQQKVLLLGQAALATHGIFPAQDPQDNDGNGIPDLCELPKPVEPKWTQLPHGDGQGFNVASDVDWQTLAQQPPGLPGPGPNWVVADDFRSDGRPITCVRWWGSYLDPAFEPGIPPGGDAATTPLSAARRADARQIELRTEAVPAQMTAENRKRYEAMRTGKTSFGPSKLAGAETAVKPTSRNLGPGTDNCVSASPIVGDGTFAFDNTLATLDGLPDLLCDAFGTQDIDNDVWFCWTAPCTGTATIETCGLTAVDTKIAAYDGCTCPTGTGILACNDDTCGLQSQISFPVVAGQSYLLRIGTFPGAAGGTGQFTISSQGSDCNDACANATPIGDVIDLPFDTTFATPDGPGASCGLAAGCPNVWFCYTATCTGMATVDTCGSLYDTVLAVYDGCSPIGPEIACNDDSPAGPCAGSLQSSITWAVTAGQQYKIEVAGFNCSVGTGDLTVSCSAPPVVGTCGGLNEGFEAGSFLGWTTQDLTAPFFPLQVGTAGITPGFGFFVSAPTEGIFAALHGFDGDGPGTIRVAQDMAIPAGTTTLDFDYRAAWDLVTFGAVLDRTFTVDIEPAGGGVALQTDLILTATAGTIQADTGPLAGSVNVTAFAGSTVQVAFEWFVPENFSGPAFFQLDNIRCTGGGPPAGTDVDGWLLSFHTDEPLGPKGFSQPLDLLGLYFCPEAVISIQPTGIFGWDGHQVFEYVVELQDCHLIHSLADPRIPLGDPDPVPAQPDAFLETQDFIYWLDIQAVVGHTYVHGLCGCDCDLNGDGLCDAADIAGFAACLGSPTPPGCDQADFDCDGDVDADDQAILNCLLAGGAPDQCCPNLGDPLWLEVETTNRAQAHFWGWHTSPDAFNDQSVMGDLVMGPLGEWIYQNWQVVDGLPHNLPTVDQAFELLTPIVCPCLGDMDGSGILDGLDIQNFVDCMLGVAAPGVNCLCADMDSDGILDLIDVRLFITAVLNKTPCP